MRKRLTEKFTKAKKGSLGYTLTEMLVVVGIIAALCAIAIPSIFAIRNSLRFATANNYAKSIFLAAQQNLTELRSDGGLGPVQSAAGASKIPASVTSFPDQFRSEYVYTVTGKEAFNRVLPAGAIDADLRDDQIVIEYNPITGNVYSVFYFDKDAATLNLEQTYESGSLPREKDARRDLMVGYYDGSGLNSAQIELEKTQAVVEFINGEEGIVQVKVPMPESFYGKFSEFAEGLNVSLTLTGEWSMTQPDASGVTPRVLTLQVKTAGTQDGCTLAADGKTVVLSYVIDSLASRKSFANFASGTQAVTAGGAANTAGSLTDLIDESKFIYDILPGENITIQADVTFDGTGSDMVQIEPGILSGVNPMFEYLQPLGDGGYVLAVSNGRNLQNLNAIAPTIADMVENVTFVSDIYWNDTVAYYNNNYAGGSTYRTGATVSGNHVYDEAPARALPYFVPIHNEKLFGTARFIYPGDGDGGLGDIINNILNALTGGFFGRYSSSSTPTLTDELDNRSGVSHASIQGNGHAVYNINIDSTKYQIPNEGEKGYVNVNGTATETDLTGTFYATGENQFVDYCFTGLFGYVNTPINSLSVVNPIVKGYKLEQKTIYVPNYILGFIPAGTKPAYLYNNPATGALLGAGGYNTLITDCSAYVDKNARGYRNLNWGPYTYDATSDQNWYGVSGTGAVGGLVGYAKSHHSVTGELTNDEAHLAFARCFAALPVSGEMRTQTNKNFGYSNGVGAFIGNSQLTNFYNCYSSGEVLATGCMVKKTTTDLLIGSLIENLAKLFGQNIDLPYDGRHSWGAGGFVGTSHGTRYTNCFSTGDVTASTASSTAVKNLGAGGFVGFMSIDETFSYGNEENPTNTDIAQRTVFTDCYSVGVAVTNGSNYENFSGANGRVALRLTTTSTYFIGDYFRLYAPHYVQQGQTAPGYEDYYVYRDTYFLSNYHTDATSQLNSSYCANSDTYAYFTDMVGSHEYGSQWMLDEIQEIKDIHLYTSLLGRRHTYDTDYFQEEPELNRIYQELYAEGYSADDWESATASTTHPYSLTEGNRYPFTKLKGMDYYGDWPSKPSDVGLAYYETYEDSDKTHYFFDQNHTEYESLTLRSDTDAIVKKDGYSIFSADDSDLRVTIGNVTAELKAEAETYTVAQKAYHVFHLTDELMAQLPEEGEYYVKVTASHYGSDDTYTMYYNPNVGLSHVNPVESKLAAVKPDKAPTLIYVRSARQFKGIATLDDFWTADTRFVQQLNIDASKYDWGKNVAVPKLTAIGIDGEKTRFESDYSAGYTDEQGEEQRYKIAGFTSADIALFGAIGEKGSISNLIIECSDFTAGSDKTENAAILAAANYGQIDNVALNISGNVTLTATNNAGLLAGLTTGDVTKCDVTTAANKTININALNAGGMIGAVEGTGEVPEGATEAVLIAVNKSTLTVGGKLNLTGGAGNAGGLIGKAAYMSAEDLRVNINELTGDTLYLGGLAGYVTNSNFTGSIGDGNSTNPVEVTVNTIASTNTDGYAAGVLGYAENTMLTAMDVTVHSVTGNIAAGFLGNSSNADATNCDVVVTGTITGTAGAAGVAGVIGPQSVFSDVPVLLSGTTIQGADAAGYALEIKGDAFVMGNSHVTLGNSTDTKTTISATANAAGFAVTTAGTIGDSNVVGFGAISGDQAAGYAINASGNIAGCHVSPALTNDNYLGNDNENLAVSGTTAAAGFAMNLAKDSTIANCYTLCGITATGKVDETATAAYGFVGTNKGTINRCMNNVHIVDGFAFVGVNDGLVTTSYGWFGDGNREIATTTRNEMTGSGKCYSSYFADLEPEYRTDPVVALYNAEGNVSHITPSALQMAELAGFVDGYKEYPFSAIEESYPYPMLRDHYGDWITPPQFAYGVAYYEEYTDSEGKTQRRYQMVDLSNPALTEEGQKHISFPNDTFDNSGVITKAGYAKFYNNQMGEMEGRDFQLTIEPYTFDFYDIETVGVETIAATKTGTKSAVVDTRFAKAIKTASDGATASFGDNETFEIRTDKQLANIGAVAANFSQTHDIATTDVTSATIAANRTYNGNGLKLDITGQTKAWLTSVGGTVQNLNLSVDAVAAKVFDNVSGTVNNLNLTIPGAVSAPVFDNVSGTVNVTLKELGSIDANGALVGTTSGSFTTGDVTTAEIAANGAIIGKVTNGTVTVGAITTGAVNGNVVTSVEGGTITTGAITTGNVNGAVFGGVSGNGTAVNTGAIETGDVTGAVFGGTTSGTVKTGAIKTGALTGNVFTTAAGTVETGDVSVGKVNGKIFATISGGSVKVGNITTNGKAVNGSVFGTVGATVNATSIQVGTVAGKVFETIGGNVNVSGVTASSAASDADNWLIGSVTGGTSSLGDIEIQAVSVVTNEPDTTDAQGNVVKTKVKKAAATPGMIGSVTGGTLELGTVTLGNVTGVNGWLIDSISNVTAVEIGAVTVNNATETETTKLDPVTQVETPVDTKTTYEPVSNMIGQISGGTVTGSTVTLGGASINGHLFSGISNNATLKNFNVVGAGSMGASLIGNTTSGKISGVSVKAGSAVIGADVQGLLLNTLGANTEVNGCSVEVTAEVSVSAPIFGGLVGEMTGGKIVDSSVSGKLTKASSGTTHIVGGAIGKMTGGTAEGVTASVAVSSAFANANYYVDGVNTFGTSGIDYKGPVGMFVGYAGDVALKNCSSEDKNNATFQFLGEAMLSSKPITGDLWVTDKNYSSLVTSELEATQVNGPVTAASGENSAELSKASGNYYYVETELNGCTFYLKSGETAVQKTQTVGANQYFYSMKSDNTKMYTIGDPNKVELAGNKTKQYTVRSNTPTIPTSAPEDTGYYVKVSDNLYAKAYVTSSRTEEWFVIGTSYTYTYKLCYLNESGTFTEIANQTKTARADNWGGTGTITFSDLYELPAAQKTLSNGAYLIVTDSTAVTGNSSGMSIADKTTFKNYDPLYGYLYNYTAPNMTNGSESYTVALLDKYFTSTSQLAAYTIGNLQHNGVTQFNLYPVSETVDNNHIVMTFTNQTSADQSRQYVAATPVGTEPQVAEAMVIDTEATEPVATEPEATEPEVTEPQVTE